MRSALTQFEENVRRARELGAVAAAVQAITTIAIDVSDMWRAQIVLAVSALDHFVHELTRLGMLEIAEGRRPRTEAYSRFPVPVSAVEAAISGIPYESWLGETVRDKHSWLSFQQPDKIADAIRLISPVELWNDVGSDMGIPAADVKTSLKVIADRRNKIAHEADMDPANPGFRWPITEILVTDTLGFVERVGASIYAVVV